MERELLSFSISNSLLVQLLGAYSLSLEVGVPLNDSVILLHKPAGVGVAPDREIVFVHGLQLSDSKDAFWKTWTVGKNGEECWPMTWLSTSFPKARILSLSYDSSVFKTSTTGRMDSFLAGETLVQEMVLARIGQHNCPVVFVCHSFGGLVVKEILKSAYDKEDDAKYLNLLKNTRGIHFYATPHQGSKLADLAVAIPIKSKSKMVEALTTLNSDTSRLNDSFDALHTKLQKRYNVKWEFAVVAEKNATKYHVFSNTVVSEASARHIGYKNYMVVNTDHCGVCKPDSTSSSSYLSLEHFIREVEGEVTEELM